MNKRRVNEPMIGGIRYKAFKYFKQKELELKKKKKKHK